MQQNHIKGWIAAFPGAQGSRGHHRHGAATRRHRASTFDTGGGYQQAMRMTHLLRSRGQWHSIARDDQAIGAQTWNGVLGAAVSQHVAFLRWPCKRLGRTTLPATAVPETVACVALAEGSSRRLWPARVEPAGSRTSTISDGSLWGPRLVCGSGTGAEDWCDSLFAGKQVGAVPTQTEAMPHQAAVGQRWVWTSLAMEFEHVRREGRLQAGGDATT